MRKEKVAAPAPPDSPNGRAAYLQQLATEAPQLAAKLPLNEQEYVHWVRVINDRLRSGRYIEDEARAWLIWMQVKCLQYF